MKRLTILTLAMCLVATPATAQLCDTGLRAAHKVVTDSLIAETFRRGTTGTLLAPRRLVVRRLTARAHDIVQQCGLVATASIGFNYTTGALWGPHPNSARGIPGTFPNSTTGNYPFRTVVCADVQIDGVNHVGTPPIAVTAHSIDSLTFVELPVTTEGSVREACIKVWPGSIIGVRTWPVRWEWLSTEAYGRIPIPKPILP